MDEEVAHYFIGKTCCLFKIFIPKGTKCIYLSLLELVDHDLEYMEKEIILAPYSSFKLIDKYTPITKWYEFSKLNEYRVTYQESKTSSYNQFERYKNLLLSIYIDKNIKDTVSIIKNNPINLTQFLFKLIYENGIFKNEICNVILDKKIKIKIEYILYAISSKVDNNIIFKMIESTKEIVLKEPFKEVVLTAANNDNLEIIKYLNLHYTEYMDTYINNTIKNKIKKWFTA